MCIDIGDRFHQRIISLAAIAMIFVYMLWQWEKLFYDTCIFDFQIEGRPKTYNVPLTLRRNIYYDEQYRRKQIHFPQPIKCTSLLLSSIEEYGYLNPMPPFSRYSFSRGGISKFIIGQKEFIWASRD